MSRPPLLLCPSRRGDITIRPELYQQACCIGLHLEVVHSQEGLATYIRLPLESLTSAAISSVCQAQQIAMSSSQFNCHTGIKEVNVYNLSWRR